MPLGPLFDRYPWIMKIALLFTLFLIGVLLFPDPEDANWGDESITQLAILEKNSSLCDGLTPQSEDVFFIYKIKKGLTYDSIHDDCIKELAKETSNPGLCDKIINNIHLDSCIRGVAAKTGNQSLCDKIEWKQMRDLCKQDAAA